MDPLDAIRDVFFQECEEQLVALESGLLQLMDGKDDSELVNAVFRAVHSIKGGAGAFGLDELVEFSHVFENSLDALRSNQLASTPQVLETFLKSADVLSDLVRAAQRGETGSAERTSAALQELQALNVGGGPSGNAESETDPVAELMAEIQAEQKDAASEPSGTQWSIWLKPRLSLYARANDPLFVLRDLQRLGPCEVRLIATELPAFPAMEPDGAYLAWEVRLRTDRGEDDIRETFEFIEGDCEYRIEPVTDTPVEAPAAPVEDAAPPVATPDEPPTAIADAATRPTAPVTAPQAAAAVDTGQAREEPAAGQATIRVELDRVDRMIDLVGELVINSAMLTQRCLEADIGRSSPVAIALAELDRLTREIQDSVMAIRAQPVGAVFKRMHRLVREVAASTGKHVKLLIEGENTEVDKTVIEHLADPLTHMIRNAIDHGIESPEQRKLAGKPEHGTVRLSAAHRSGRIVITVADDGAGIDRARVRASAVAKGVIAADAVLTDSEIDELIFAPGFSTASKISNISGRGVGMDVVKRSIQSLGGRIGIQSEFGKGCTFTLILPLTLAVLDGMVVTVADKTLVLPLSAVIETLQPRQENVHELSVESQMLNVRGSFIPMLSAARALGWQDDQATASQIAILIEDTNRRRASLLVDTIEGQQQVVIKSLEQNYRSVEGVAAATILGDGRVALILDVDGVLAGKRQESFLN